VYVASTEQLPDGFGPYVIPPFSERVAGNTIISLAKVNVVESMTFGSPLMVRFEPTLQFVGVTVRVVLSDPLPELRVKSKVPATPIVPPSGQFVLLFIEKLQVVVVPLVVQPGSWSG